MVEGESPYKLAPGVGGDENEGEQSSDSETDEQPGAGRGTVFRLTKGLLRKLDGGMQQYEEIASRRAAKLGAGKGKSADVRGQSDTRGRGRG